MELSISHKIFIQGKKINGSMRPGYTCYTILEKGIVLILHICGARAIFLQFCDLQDIECE